MMKRVTWFAAGAVAGAAGAGYAKKKVTRTVKQTASQLAPVNVAKGAVVRARGQAGSLSEAVREGRAAMRAKEAELRARVDGRAISLDDALAPGDEVLVDGRPVAPGQVIVLRQVPDEGPRRRSRTRDSASSVGAGRRRSR